MPRTACRCCKRCVPRACCHGRSRRVGGMPVSCTPGAAATVAPDTAVQSVVVHKGGMARPPQQQHSVKQSSSRWWLRGFGSTSLDEAPDVVAQGMPAVSTAAPGKHPQQHTVDAASLEALKVIQRRLLHPTPVEYPGLVVFDAVQKVTRLLQSRADAQTSRKDRRRQASRKYWARMRREQYKQGFGADAGGAGAGPAKSPAGSKDPKAWGVHPDMHKMMENGTSGSSEEPWTSSDSESDDDDKGQAANLMGPPSPQWLMPGSRSPHTPAAHPPARSPLAARQFADPAIRKFSDPNLLQLISGSGINSAVGPSGASVAGSGPMSATTTPSGLLLVEYEPHAPGGTAAGVGVGVGAGALAGAGTTATAGAGSGTGTSVAAAAAAAADGLHQRPVVRLQSGQALFMRSDSMQSVASNASSLPGTSVGAASAAAARTAADAVRDSQIKSLQQSMDDIKTMLAGLRPPPPS